MTAIKRGAQTLAGRWVREGPARKSLQPHHTHSRRALCKELAAHWHNSGAKGLTIETVDGMRRLDEKLIFTMRESCLLQHHDEEAGRCAHRVPFLSIWIRNLCMCRDRVGVNLLCVCVCMASDERTNVHLEPHQRKRLFFMCIQESVGPDPARSLIAAAVTNAAAAPFIISPVWSNKHASTERWVKHAENVTHRTRFARREMCWVDYKSRGWDARSMN